MYESSYEASLTRKIKLQCLSYLGYITLVPARIFTSPHREGRGCKEAMADEDEFLMDSDTSHEDEEEGGHHVLKILAL